MILLFMISSLAFITFMILFNTNNYYDNYILQNETGKIIERKSSYTIIQIDHTKFYLYDQDQQFVLGQTIKISGTINKMDDSSTNYYQFNFDNYLKTKFVNFEITKFSFNVTGNGLRSLFWSSINNLEINNLYKIFIFNDHSQNYEIYQKIAAINLEYLINFNSANIFPIIYLINKLIRKNKKFIVIKISFIFLLSIWCFLLNFPLVMFRLLIDLYFKTYMEIFKRQISRDTKNFFISFIIIVLFPSYGFSPGFWFLTAAYWFLKPISFQSSWQEKGKNLVIVCLIFYPLQVYFDYNLNFLEEFMTIIIIPFTAFYYLFLILFWWLPPQVFVEMENYYLNLLSFFEVISYTINIGHQSIFTIIGFYIILFWLISLKITNYKQWLILIIYSIISYFINWIAKDSNYIAMLNVGNGNSFVYYDKWKNNCILFDIGSGSGFSKTNTLDFLKYNGINKIDYIFVTHFDSDHINQIYSIKENIKVNEVITRETNENFITYQNISIWIFNNEVINNGLSSENNKSLTLIVDIGDFRMVFVGDSEREAENWLMNNYLFTEAIKYKQPDLLQFGHHGSKTSSSKEFIALINPKVAFISGMNKGSLHFPNIETIETLNELDIKYYVTNGVNNYLIKTSNNYIWTK